MDTKTLYLYDEDGFYAGMTILVASDKDPETGEWIIPENSTEVPMELEYKEHYRPHWNGTAWEYAVDENNPPPEEPPEPTPEEIKQQQLDALDAQYVSDKNELLLYYVDALIHEDETEQQATKNDLTTLNEQFDADYEAIVNGEEE
jgi:hypothetical protein